MIKNKLRSRAGESISETLIALLISALAIVMLAGAITAASSIVKKSRETLNSYYQENEKMAAVTDAWVPDSVTITEDADKQDPAEFEIPVKSYTNETFSGNTVEAYVLEE